MCNAWNHPAGCQCGWGGEGHLGRSGGFAPHDFLQPIHSYHSYTNPNAHCPVCGASCYFYQSPDGGRVFFDSLGPPWPKHPCTDNANYRSRRTDYIGDYTVGAVYDWQRKGWEPFFSTGTEAKPNGWFQVTGYADESVRHVLFVRNVNWWVSGRPIFLKRINDTFGLYQLVTFQLNPATLETTNIYVPAFARQNSEVEKKVNAKGFSQFCLEAPTKKEARADSASYQQGNPARC